MSFRVATRKRAGATNSYVVIFPLFPLSRTVYFFCIAKVKNENFK